MCKLEKILNMKDLKPFDTDGVELVKSNVADKESDNISRVIQAEIFEEQEKVEQKYDGGYHGKTE